MLADVQAAFFDLDKTVIAKASMVAFGRPLLQAGMISRRLMVRALWGQLVFQWFGASEEKMRKLRESALRITRGWDQAHISEIVRDNLTEVIEPIVFEEALQLIRQHQQDAHKVFIISASPEEIVAPLGEFLGVDGVIATRASIDDEGRYTGAVDFYSYGPYKAEAMNEIAAREDIDLTASFAYSDSMTDLPMLEAVGHPVVVNPDRELARIARNREWEVRIFRIGVPLRERVPMPRPRNTLFVVGGAATVGAGAALVWWLLRREPPPPPKRAGRMRARFRTPAASSPRKRPGRARR
jgi:HAD superfamily hydrolase (TIGR01490 family)